LKLNGRVLGYSTRVPSIYCESYECSTSDRFWGRCQHANKGLVKHVLPLAVWCKWKWVASIHINARTLHWC